MKYLLKYTFSLPDKTNKKARLGSVVHKSAEILAKYKLALQNKETQFEEDGNIIQVSDVNLKFCSEYAFDCYKQDDWTLADFETCDSWFKKAISYENGLYDPRNLDIVAVEHFFDFTVDEDWAGYFYQIGDKVLQGNLAIRGTIDLIYKKDSRYYMLDYKTGRNTDFVSGKEKTYETMLNEPQFHIYNVAIHKTLPQIDEIIFTMFYINYQPISVAFSREDDKRCWQTIKNRFNEIKRNQNPSNILNTSRKWVCQYLCAFSEELPNGSTLCKSVTEAIKKHGLSKVTEQFIDIGKLNRYEGGGSERKL